VSELRPAWLIAGALAVLAACGGTRAPAPADPTPGKGVSLVSLTPSSGASLEVEECRLGDTGAVRVMCTRAIQLAASAIYDRPIAIASVFADFYTADGRRCAAASPVGRPGVPAISMTPARPQAFDIAPVVVSFPLDFPTPLCPLPVTTTRIDLVLIDASTANFQRLVKSEVAATYTFRSKP
jgi:hypothetical protein